MSMFSLFDYKSADKKFIYICNNCENENPIVYNCKICKDFDLCSKCYSETGHPHKMYLGDHLDNLNVPTETIQKLKEARIFEIKVMFCFGNLYDRNNNINLNTI